MPSSLLLLWAVAGWSAASAMGWASYTPGREDPDNPRPWPFPWPPPWRWFVLRVIGVVFGIIGGLVYTRIFEAPQAWTLALPAAASAFGAFLVAGAATDIAGRFIGGPRA
jgi:hypothetical protein